MTAPRQERDILKLCKLNINSSITVPGECNNLNDLIKALKAHPIFSIYKDGIKRKLDQMKFEENKTPYLKARDRVYLRTETDYMLRSQDVTFEIEDDNENKNDKNDTKPLIFQEVVGHKEKIGRDDEWLIEKR
ncbi:hypothetical protein RhiirA5_373640 [Rhizophagus irregularis]|uniref:MIR domain-containing protein n=1 Tax=Rhizophagus irregularis TaxID=588596 RepID=A0A2N0PXZ9_9GLOM|nr:hypothetical protein RhiirA5_373640 [Rhizophagus irregularis]